MERRVATKLAFSLPQQPNSSKMSEMINCHCPKFGKSYQLPDGCAGTGFVCNNPGCGKRLKIPPNPSNSTGGDSTAVWSDLANDSVADADDSADQHQPDDGETELFINGERIRWKVVNGTIEGVRKESNAHVHGSGFIYQGTGAMNVGTSIPLQSLADAADGSSRPVESDCPAGFNPQPSLSSHV
jgi:hypothetical protein